jgi:hypothetical protein
MIAQAQYTDGSIVEVTAQATWTSDAPTILYVDPSGLATALALGTAHVQASFAGFCRRHRRSWSCRRCRSKRCRRGIASFHLEAATPCC